MRLVCNVIQFYQHDLFHVHRHAELGKVWGVSEGGGLKSKIFVFINILDRIVSICKCHTHTQKDSSCMFRGKMHA